MDGIKRSIKYLYCPCKNSKKLVVIFSAFPGTGKTAGYNLVSTLKNVNINKLYILDDYGYKNRGAYYLSEDGDFYIIKLVDEIIHKYSVGMEHRTFIGSSKGGYAALYYGIRLGADRIITGAPQYYLGNYLTCKEDHIPILDVMAGDHDDNTVKKYNKLLPDIVSEMSKENKTEIIVHYSPNEPTYETHIKDMLKDLARNNYNLKEDIKDYENHSDVAKYFPDLCLKFINNMEEI